MDGYELELNEFIWTFLPKQSIIIIQRNKL